MAAEDYYDLFYEPFDYEREDQGVTCKYCGCEELAWIMVNERWKLFDPETEQIHACHQTFDVFTARK